jgi:Tol biopolymer transport system component
VTDGVNLGELCRRKVLLFTREAAAIVHEVSTRLGEAERRGTPLVAPTADQLSVTPNGELISDVPTAAVMPGRDETMAALSSLIERLLPPTLRDQPDYAVPGSFRVLAPRARGWPPGLPPLKTPEDLAAAVSRYRGSDTTAVLRNLYARTVPAPAPPARVETAREPERVTAVPVSDAPPTAGATMSNSGSSAWEEEDEFDLPLRTSTTAPMPGLVSEPLRRRVHLWHWAASAVVLALAAGYVVTHWTILRSEISARISENAFASRIWNSLAVTTRAPAPQTEVAVPSQGDGGSVAQTDGSRSTDTTPRPATTALKRRAEAPAHPNGAGFVVRSSTSLPVSPSTAPAPLEIPADGPVFSPSFTASGSTVIFHTGRDPAARLLSAELRDGSAPLELVTILDGAGRNYHPRLSPDGRYLAFDSDRDGERGVYIANRDGSEVRRISGPGFAAVPSWSPDMRALAFVRAEPDRPRVWNLWRLDRHTGKQTRLTSLRYGQPWGASWLPDSRRLCYSHEDRLVVLDTESGETHTYASPLPGRLVRTPAVSSDGRLVAFQVMRSGVWILELESGAMRRLIDDPSAEEFAWSPDGGRLAYHSRRDGEWRIWIAAAPREVPESP